MFSINIQDKIRWNIQINQMGSCCSVCSQAEAVIPASYSPEKLKLEANQSSLQPLSQPGNLPINSHPQQVGNQALNSPLIQIESGSKDIQKKHTKYLPPLKQKINPHIENQISPPSHQLPINPSLIDPINSKSSDKPIIRNNSAQKQSLSNTILNNFTIGKQLAEMLNDVSFSENQAQDLCKALINAIYVLQKESQNLQERKAVEEIFNQQNIQLIKKGELYYNGMLDKLQNAIKSLKLNNKQNVTLSQYSKSRIYHTIANLKKQPKVLRLYRNFFGVKCIESNDYKLLNQQELDQVVRYESIAEKVKSIGENIGFKYKSVKDQSQKISNLLAKCLQNHMNTIKQLRYDLSVEQVMKMAAISRQACIYYDNGVYILLVYFVQACRRLQKQSKSPSEIEKLLQKAIDVIYQEYPPAKGLSSEHVELISKLKQLQTSGYTKVSFKHETIELKCQDKDKQEQVEKIIIKYAQIAEQCKDSFEKLVKATCLEKGVYFKIGLKYYAKKPNLKAMTRIKEKMYFKKDSTASKKMTEDNIKSVLDKEQLEYKTEIDRILKEKDTVQFKISDMVRGKCVFLQVGDIIHTVNLIKKFVANNPKFGIAQIESRFSNPTPISDVTLKIVLDNKIVAELQLTIQTNSAAYAFSHKIYELYRTKVFSKLKIIHNYFEESKQEFSQLVKKSLALLLKENSISPQITKDISQYFKLDSKFQSFEDILFNFTSESKMQVRKLQISVDPLLQDLISVAFNLAIGKWGKDIGNILNKTLKKVQLSSKIKSVALSIFLYKLSLPKQSQNMQQLGIVQEQLKQKIYMQQFLRQFFSIQQAFKCGRQNQRLYHRALQLHQIVFYKSQQSYPIELKQTMFVDNLVIGQHVFQKVQQLQEFFNFYFVTRNEDNTIYPLFRNYFRWLEKQITLVKDSKIKQLNHQIKIVEAQYLIQNNKQKQAEKLLLNPLKFFKGIQDQQRVIDCEILLAECYIMQQQELSLQQVNKYYEKNVLQKAKIMGFEVKGVLYSDSLQRIQQKQQTKCKEQNDYKILLQTFTMRALEQMSRSKGKQFIYAIIRRWPEYEKHKLLKPKIKQNQHIKNVRLIDIQSQGCEHLSKADWKNITTLSLNENNIGPEGCEHLSKSDWKNITTINLTYNNIGDVGCEHLSKADWKNITTLNLDYNNIGPVGCKHLSQADWKKMTTLNLLRNKIGDVGCEYLSKADWKNIITLDLRSNNIGPAGCEHLIRASWKKITALYFGDNHIGDLGCQHLSKADWKNITMLYLNENNIGPKGCEHLIRADWKNITTLNLESNNIGDVGCEVLNKAGWNNITTLYLKRNNIGDVGCVHLSKAGWKNITMLDLYENKIGDVGCDHLGKADWKKITTLFLGQNKIGDKGCEYLSKADWKQLNILYLKKNQISKNRQSVKQLFTQTNLKIDI